MAPPHERTGDVVVACESVLVARETAAWRAHRRVRREALTRCAVQHRPGYAIAQAAPAAQAGNRAVLAAPGDVTADDCAGRAPAIIIVGGSGLPAERPLPKIKKQPGQPCRAGTALDVAGCRCRAESSAETGSCQCVATG